MFSEWTCSATGAVLHLELATCALGSQCEVADGESADHDFTVISRVMLRTEMPVR